TPSYVGSQSSFIGLEQINVEIPRNFIGNQQLEIQVTGGVPSNRTVVTLNVPPLTEAHWRASGIEGQDVHSFAAAGETLVAGAARGIYRLGDDGTYWAESPYSFPTGEQKRRALALLAGDGPGINQTQFLAGTDGSGLWYTSGRADAWTTGELDKPLFNERILSLARSQRGTFAGTASNGVFRQSRDAGSIFQSVGLTGQKITALAASGDRVFAGTEMNGVMVTTDEGGHWTKVEGGLPADARILTLAVK